MPQCDQIAASGRRRAYLGKTLQSSVRLLARLNIVRHELVKEVEHLQALKVTSQYDTATRGCNIIDMLDKIVENVADDALCHEPTLRASIVHQHAARVRHVI